jgi:hypothetical protein
MGWLAALLALWTAFASVAPAAVARCESPRCRCCAAADDEGPALQRPPCCGRDDVSRTPATPVAAPRTGVAFELGPAVIEVERPELAAFREASAIVLPTRIARAPPAQAWLRLGRLLL